MSGAYSRGYFDTKVYVISSAASSTTKTLPATTGLAAYWKPLGSSVINNQVDASDLICGHHVCEINGRFIVPPGRYFAINCVDGTTFGQFYHLGIEWTEKYLQIC